MVPEPLLVGRDPAKLEALAAAHGLDRFALDLDAALEDPDYEIFFDAASTKLRAGLLQRAIAAGKHVYCEKPIAENLDDALAVWRAAQAGIRHGVVQDKLWPRAAEAEDAARCRLLRAHPVGQGRLRLLGVRGRRAGRAAPVLELQEEEGGGIILDMLCHWRYVLDNLFGAVERVFCLGANHIPERFDERGARYVADAEDAAYAVFELAGGVAQINSSGARVRDDLWCSRSTALKAPRSPA